MSRRWTRPEPELPVEGETSYQASQRRARNRLARARFNAFISESCSFCGLSRGNVIHEEDPATAPEGPEYFADMALHYFVESGSGSIWIEPSGSAR